MHVRRGYLACAAAEAQEIHAAATRVSKTQDVMTVFLDPCKYRCGDATHSSLANTLRLRSGSSGSTATSLAVVFCQHSCCCGVFLLQLSAHSSFHQTTATPHNGKGWGTAAATKVCNTPAWRETVNATATVCLKQAIHLLGCHTGEPQSSSWPLSRCCTCC